MLAKVNTRPNKNALYRWELALMIAIALFLLLGTWLNRQQSELAGSVIRLHVLANSDSDADQALKLKVRDRILQEASGILNGDTDVSTASTALEGQLDHLASVGQEVVNAEGYNYTVTAALEHTWFPTKQYDDFALPAGNYLALRVKIGAAEGHNWWCVVFPPLCVASVSETVEETAASAGLTQDQISLMTSDSDQYVLKFHLIEWWDEMKNNF